LRGMLGAHTAFLQARPRPKGVGQRGPRPTARAIVAVGNAHRPRPPGVFPPCKGVPSRVGAGAFTILGCPFRAPRLLGGEVPRAVPAATCVCETDETNRWKIESDADMASGS